MPSSGRNESVPSRDSCDEQRKRGSDVEQAIKRLTAMEWTYAGGDPKARAELARRIAEVGRTAEDFVTYSRLVADVTFKLSNVNGGKPFEIREWTNLDRAIIGSFLGRIAVDSYRKGKFLASALVIGVDSNGPGDGFYNLAEEAGLLSSSDEMTRLKFWFEHVRLARAWYASH